MPIARALFAVSRPGSVSHLGNRMHARGRESRTICRVSSGRKHHEACSLFLSESGNAFVSSHDSIGRYSERAERILFMRIDTRNIDDNVGLESTREDVQRGVDVRQVRIVSDVARHTYVDRALELNP